MNIYGEFVREERGHGVMFGVCDHILSSASAFAPKACCGAARGKRASRTWSAIALSKRKKELANQTRRFNSVSDFLGPQLLLRGQCTGPGCIFRPAETPHFTTI